MLTVVTPAAQRLTTATAAATAGLAGVTDNEIAAASDAIAAHCGRVFGRETVTETFRPVAAAAVGLARYPVTAITAWDRDGAAMDLDAYDLDPASGLLWRLAGRSRIGWDCAGISVTYTGGYLLPGVAGRDLPAGIERACILTLSAWRHPDARDPLLRSESTEGVGSASWIANAEMDALPPQATSLLAPFVRIVV